MRLGVLARGVVGSELVAALRGRGLAVALVASGAESLPDVPDEALVRPDPEEPLLSALVERRRIDAWVRVGGGGRRDDALWAALQNAAPGLPVFEIGIADPPDPLAHTLLGPLFAGAPCVRLPVRQIADGSREVAAPADCPAPDTGSPPVRDLDVVVALRPRERGAALIRRALVVAAARIGAALTGNAVPAALATGEGETIPASPLATELDWSLGARALARRVRALAPPFCGAEAVLGATRAVVLTARPTTWSGASDAPPGTLDTHDGDPRVRCGQGALRISRARVAGAVVQAAELGDLLRAEASATAADATGDYLAFGVPTLGREEEEAVLRVLRSRWIGTGPDVERLENEFAARVGARHAVAVSSCTAALHLALVGADIGPGDEVITTTLTFVATANAILHTGATPVLVDVDPDTLNIDPAAVEAAIGPRTRALLPVHFAGRPCDLTPLRALARRHGLALIEDAAHAVGALHATGDAVGGGRAEACFSFYPNKNITSAEGGMLTTASARRAGRYRRLRLHGLSNDAWRRYGSRAFVRSRMLELGFKYNMTDLQAAIGRVQLARLESFTRIRNEHAERYREALAGLEHLRPVAAVENGRHAYHLFTVFVDGIDRDAAILALREQGIGAAVHYVPVHRQPYYRERLGIRAGALPVAEHVGATTLSLPIGPSLGDAEVRRVIQGLRSLEAHPPQGAGKSPQRRVSTPPCRPRSTTWVAGSPDELR